MWSLDSALHMSYTLLAGRTTMPVLWLEEPTWGDSARRGGRLTVLLAPSAKVKVQLRQEDSCCPGVCNRSRGYPYSTRHGRFHSRAVVVVEPERGMHG